MIKKTRYNPINNQSSFDVNWDEAPPPKSTHMNKIDDQTWDGIEKRIEASTLRAMNSAWDGIDRRQQSNLTTIDKVNQSSNSSQGMTKFFSNGTVISILFSIIVTSGSFIFDLYNRIRDLEYKHTNILERLVDISKQNEDLKKQIKEFDAHINSVEESVMQIYRSTTKK